MRLFQTANIEIYNEKNIWRKLLDSLRHLGTDALQIPIAMTIFASTTHGHLVAKYSIRSISGILISHINLSLSLEFKGYGL